MAGRDFVLVHGAWRGGWCWGPVRDRLTARGHRVFTPTLTGLGERAHLMSGAIDLDTHIQDVVGVFEFEDVRDAVLVAHSYGGWPVSGALEQISARVRAVVFLDAFVPQDGQRGIDMQSAESAAGVRAALARGDVSRPGPTAAAFGGRPDAAAWIDARTTPQPIGVSLQPIRLTGARERVARKVYVRATSYPQPTFDRHLQEARAAGWETHEMPVGHDLMVDAPDAVADLLASISAP